MKKTIIAATVATVAVATQAHAQEASNFGGAKIGAVVGYDKVRLKLDGESGSKDGVLYGVTAGYDFDLGSAVVGIEAEATDASTKESVTDVISIGDEARLSAGRDLYVGARIGVPVSNRILVYAKVGYTNARFKASYDDGVDTLTGSDNLDGYRAGAGVEMSTGQGFVRAEYRYSDYGKYSYAGIDTGIKAARHQVAISGGIRF